MRAFSLAISAAASVWAPEAAAQASKPLTFGATIYDSWEADGGVASSTFKGTLGFSDKFTFRGKAWERIDFVLETGVRNASLHLKNAKGRQVDLTGKSMGRERSYVLLPADGEYALTVDQLGGQPGVPYKLRAKRTAPVIRTISVGQKVEGVIPSDAPSDHDKQFVLYHLKPERETPVQIEASRYARLTGASTDWVTSYPSGESIPWTAEPSGIYVRIDGKAGEPYTLAVSDRTEAVLAERREAAAARLAAAGLLAPGATLTGGFSEKISQTEYRIDGKKGQWILLTASSPERPVQLTMDNNDPVERRGGGAQAGPGKIARVYGQLPSDGPWIVKVRNPDWRNKSGGYSVTYQLSDTPQAPSAAKPPSGS